MTTIQSASIIPSTPNAANDLLIEDGGGGGYGGGGGGYYGGGGGGYYGGGGGGYYGGGGGGYYGGGGGGYYGSGGYGSYSGGGTYSGYGAYGGGDYSAYYSGDGYSSSNPDGYTSPDDVGGPAKGGGPTTQARDTSVPSTTTRADGTTATLTFNGKTSDGLTGDQNVTAKLASTVGSILDADSDLTTANVSATTNGHTQGDHVYGDAIDINTINGTHVAASGDGLTVATALENAAMANPDVRYVEGPMGNFARSTPGGDFVPSAHLDGDTSHVHISVFPVH